MFEREYSREFERDFNELSEQAFVRVEKSTGILAQYPELAKEYLPYNDVGGTALPIRYYPVPHTYLGLFFEVHRAQQALRFLRILDVRRDPMHIFESLSDITFS